MITRQSYKESHEELSRLLKYPPFNTERDEDDKWLGDVAGDEIMAYNREVILPVTEKDPNWETIEGEPHEEFREKWAEEIEEAKLFQARYGDDYRAATNAVLGDD